MEDGKSKIIFKDHAVIRMFERGITKNEIVEVIESGKPLKNIMTIILILPAYYLKQ